MGGLNNSFEIQMMMRNQILEPIIDKATKYFLAHLRENILKYAYQGDEARPTRKKTGEKYSGGVSWYLGGTRRPSFEFLEAFKWKDLQKTSKSVIAKMVYDWQSMEYDGSADMYKHGNEYSWGDARSMLDEWLNKDGQTSTHWLARSVKPYWKKTIDRMFDQRGLEIYIRKELSKIGMSLGVKIKKI